MGTAVCEENGTEMAHWLFWQKNTTGALNTAAKLHPSWKSPSEVAPSPKYTSVARDFRSSFEPMAWPTAWMIWEPTGTLTMQNPWALASYEPPCHAAR